VGGAGNPVEIPPVFNQQGDMIMSDDKKPFTRPKVPDGHAFHVTTRQKEIVPGQFFVGYETIWEPHQKEVPYTTPKKP
jgi:hypothetical protein